MTNVSFTIGHPQLIHPSLIAVLTDLQSTVIYTVNGTLIGWIHEQNRNIEWAEGYSELYRKLINESEMKDMVKDYNRSFFKIDGTISYRQWDVKTKFIYPPTPPQPITIDTEDKY